MAPNGLVRKLQRDLEIQMSANVQEVEKEIMTLLNTKKKDIQSVKITEMDSKILETINIQDLTEDEKSDNMNHETNVNNIRIRTNKISSSQRINNNPNELEGFEKESSDDIPKETVKIIVDLLTFFSTKNGDYVSTAWKELLPSLITTYRDGMIITSTDSPIFKIQKMFYPRWWLETVGYFNQKGNPKGILFQPNPLSINYLENNIFYLILFSMIFSGIIFYFLGYYLGKKHFIFYERKKYFQINERSTSSDFSSNNFELTIKKLQQSAYQ